MLSFLKQKLSSDITEGLGVTVAESVTEDWSQDIETAVTDLKFDIYDLIKTIKDPEKPQVRWNLRLLALAYFAFKTVPNLKESLSSLLVL